MTAAALNRSRPRLLVSCLVSLPPLALAGCLVSERGGGPHPVPSAEEGLEAILVLRKSALSGASGPASAVDSILVRVTGAGMDPKEFVFAGESRTLTLTGIPPGDNRLVAASLFRGGRLLYHGQASASFAREFRTEVRLRCDPRFSRVVARFHLPPSLPLEVADGSLILTGPGGEFRAGLERKGEFGSFSIDEVPGGEHYDALLSLLDRAARPVYESRRDGLLLPLGEEARWDFALTPVSALAGLQLELSVPRETEVAARFPGALRKPARAGEIVISEFYAAPSASDSAGEGEWWEIFNRASDSLSLSGCRLSRSRGAGVTQSFSFDSSLRIPPGRALTFGRRAATADFRYADFTLVNTSSLLLLLCAGDSLRVDSLRYSALDSDSLGVPVREGWVSSLNPDSLGRSSGKASWCLTRTAHAGGTASPGWVGECE